MTEEIGAGLDIPNAKTDADGKIHAPVLYRIEGTENVDGKDLLKFEMHRAGAITNTDLLTVDEHGITCWARINLDGELIKFNPPQTMIATPLKRGAAWSFDGQAGDLKVHQRYDVTGEENIEVRAGKFHTFHIQGEQSAPSQMTIDRWFVPGVGIVKDVTTMRAANGDLLQRISLELAERPKIENKPEVKSDAGTVRQTEHGVFVRHASDLRALAKPAAAEGRKSEGRVDRREHWRRFSARLQGGRSFRCR